MVPAPASVEGAAVAPVSGSPVSVGGPPSVLSKFSARFYGFVELDAIEDSTQSFSELAGNGLIQRDNYAADHARTTFGARNSRLGFKIGGPGSDEVKTSGIVEMDFLGNQPGNPPSVSEGSYFTSPTFRIRHMALKVETPVIDILAGQYWELFGWQSYFDPNTVEIQGLPGQVYSRSPQLRLSHVFKSDDVNFELAAAASRPPQRDSGVPDVQAGLRVLANHWQGFHTAGGTGSSLDAAGIGLSGVFRHFAVAEFSAAPRDSVQKNGWGISIDGLIPVIPATKSGHANALTLTGSFVTGSGISDLYTGLTGGIGFPSLSNPTKATPAPTYTADIDNGLVTYDSIGNLHTIDWQSFIIGVQYYLPIEEVWLSANYSRMHSGNIASYGADPSKVFTDSNWYDGNLFWDMNGSARFGLEYAHFQQKYADDKRANNDRVQLSAFYIF